VKKEGFFPVQKMLNSVIKGGDAVTGEKKKSKRGGEKK